MSRLCMIPARGGSQRIPRKNIRLFLGKPIIAYGIETARQSGLFDEVMVSTDDDEIADVAQQYGASVPFRRSTKNSDNHATTVDVILEVLDTYAARNTHFETVCCLYPTAPFVTGDILHKTYQHLLDKEVGIVYPIQRFSFPIQRAFLLDDGLLRWAQPDAFLKRSQDLEPAYHDAGQFYWFDAGQLLQHRQLTGLVAGGVVIDEMAAHDIDTEADWRMAELKYQMLHNPL